MQGIRFIMVQSPEPCNPRSTAAHMGYATIAEIGAERIRRVCSPASDPRYADDNIPTITYHQAHGLAE